MAEFNIRDQHAKMQSDARDRVAQIESGKTLFLQDYQNLERKLEKELTDPGLTFDQRLIRQNRLTDLKLRWQRNGVSDIDLVISMRDSLLSTLREFSGLPEAEQDALFPTWRAHVAEFNAIISEAKSKGLI
jgi:hypothetical protein